MEQYLIALNRYHTERLISRLSAPPELTGDPLFYSYHVPDHSQDPRLLQRMVALTLRDMRYQSQTWLGTAKVRYWLGRQVYDLGSYLTLSEARPALGPSLFLNRLRPWIPNFQLVFGPLLIRDGPVIRRVVGENSSGQTSKSIDQEPERGEYEVRLSAEHQTQSSASGLTPSNNVSSVSYYLPWHNQQSRRLLLTESTRDWQPLDILTTFPERERNWAAQAILTQLVGALYVASQELTFCYNGQLRDQLYLLQLPPNAVIRYYDVLVPCPFILFLTLHPLSSCSYQGIRYTIGNERSALAPLLELLEQLTTDDNYGPAARQLLTRAHGGWYALLTTFFAPGLTTNDLILGVAPYGSIPINEDLPREVSLRDRLLHPNPTNVKLTLRSVLAPVSGSLFDYAEFKKVYDALPLLLPYSQSFGQELAAIRELAIQWQNWLDALLGSTT